jgi:hypothetical protein
MDINESNILQRFVRVRTKSALRTLCVGEDKKSMELPFTLAADPNKATDG